MSSHLTTKAGRPSKGDRLRARFVRLLVGLGVDRTGSTAIEYALTLASVALGALGITNQIGIDLSTIFGEIELQFCQQLHSVCIAR